MSVFSSVAGMDIFQHSSALDTLEKKKKEEKKTFSDSSISYQETDIVALKL